jgi:hypothetical protein
VFTNFWEAIAKYLPSKDSLLNTNLVLNFTKRPKIVYFYSKNSVKDKVIFELSMDDTQDIDFDRYENDLFKRVEEFPDHPEHQKDSLIDFIKTHSRLGSSVSDKERESKLRKALKEKGLTLRKDSGFCQSFIVHTCGCSLEEVVSVMILTAKLFGHGHKVWSNTNIEFRKKLNRMVYLGISADDDSNESSDEDENETDDDEGENEIELEEVTASSEVVHQVGSSEEDIKFPLLPSKDQWIRCAEELISSDSFESTIDEAVEQISYRDQLYSNNRYNNDRYNRYNDSDDSDGCCDYDSDY